jgi:antitoxin ParD1/3/4
MAAMTITLTPEQQAWLKAQVAAGRFPSVEDAVRVAVADLMAIDTSDLSWTKPLLDAARSQIARGECVTHEQFQRELADRIKALR